MKKVITVIVLALMFFSCSSLGPESVAKNFLENLAKGKVDEAKKYATEPTGKMLDLANNFGTLPVNPNFKFEMIRDSVVDNKAWVIFVDEEGKEDVVELVKIDGNWLVNINGKK